MKPDAADPPCPHCGESFSKVIDTRPSLSRKGVRRRRQCQHCHKRFTTMELVEETQRPSV